MVKSQELDEFCLALLEAAKAMKKANEMPTWMITKARDVNAGHVLKQFRDATENEELVAQFNKTRMDAKICTDDDFRSKKDIIRHIEEIIPHLNRIKSGNFKLMLDRFMAAHDLAREVADVVDEVYKAYMVQTGQAFPSDANASPSE